jgi:amino acid adenylation domain-containing protein
VAHLLTATQEGMLFYRLSAEGSGANVEQVLCRTRRPLDPDALIMAADFITARHAGLRVRFLWQDRAEPAQEVTEHAAPEVTFTDIFADTPEATEAELEAALAADRRADLSLSDAPPLRIACFTLPNKGYALVVTTHHIAVDRASLAVIIADLFAAYSAFLGGETPDLDPAPCLESALTLLPRCASPEALAYFRGLLGDVEARTPLDVGFSARLPPAPGAGKCALALSRAETLALAQAAERMGVSVRTLFEAAWGLLLSKYSGQTDVLFGVARDGRACLPLPLRGVVGSLVHTLPRRLRCPGEASLHGLLHEVEAQHVEQRAFEHTGLRELQACSRVPSGQLLFDSLVAFEPSALFDQIDAPDVVQLDHVYQTTFPLTLVGELGARLELCLRFDGARYDAGTAQRLLSHLQALLQSMSQAAASTALSALRMLSADERAQLLHGWNDTKGAYPDDLRIHEPFEAQAAARPEAVALRCGDAQETYAGLDARANRLAHALVARGVGRHAKVGICMPRSIDAIVAMLAVSKAGAAYVPLDPAYPDERLQFMVDDSSVGLVLCVEALDDKLGQAKAERLLLDRDADAIAAFTSDKPACPARPDDVAYIIYTSGSTGRPKGVVVRHRPALNLLDWVNQTFGVGPQDRLLFVTSICFDLSVYDIFGVLGAGGSLHIARAEDLREPQRLVELLCSGSITLWDSAPAALNQLVPFFPAPCAESALRHVMLSGDWIPVPLPDQIRETFPRAKVVSLGGATEATVWSNFYEVGEVPATWPSIPYGRPIRNARYYVLDAAGEPVPIGVPAELHIGGACLADGYLNRPELTAEKFIPDPHAQDEGGRMYRTGDLARFMPDGNLEFLGRIDSQVKVRGFRVELGEIEAVLSQDPQVTSALVDAPRLAGERTLVAYVVTKGKRFDPASLRATCQARLPEYMVPAHIMKLDALPVTANGKLDRRALPAPTSHASASFVAPRTPLERTLVTWLQTHLGAAQVGVRDHFFELGGHSLLAVRLIGEMCRRYDVELSLADFLAEPTLEALATRIAAASRLRAEGSARRPIVALPEADAVVSHDQRRLAFVQGLYPDSPVYNLTFALRLEGPLARDALAQALDAVVARHEPLRTGFCSAVEGYRAQILPHASVALAFTDLLPLAGPLRQEALSDTSRALSAQPFDLAQPPLLRANLVRLAAEEHVLLLVVHHIVFDGASLPIFVRELTAAYDALAAGSPIPLLPLAIRFNDAARHQLALVEHADFAEDLAYFRAKLSESLPTLQLPSDKPRPRAFSYRGAIAPWSLPSEATERLHTLAKSLRTSAFSLLLAAYQAYLARCSGQRDIVVGIPVALRDHEETEPLIGLLLNTLPIRTSLPVGCTFAGVQSEVRRHVLETLAHRNLPFERIVAELNPPRDPSTTPIFQAIFSYQERSQGLAQGQRLRVRSEVVEQCFAATELSFFVEDLGGEGLSGYFSYSTDLWEEGTAHRMAEGFSAFLTHAIAAPDAELDGLPVMAEEARARELYNHNRTRHPYAADASVVDLFSAAAAATPARAAVFSDQGALSYAALHAQVVALSESLRSLGARPGTGVAVALGRSPRMLVALLSVLRCGAYYIPLDPSHPEERNQRILRVSSPALLLVEADTVCALAVPEGTRTVHLDDGLPAGAAFDPHAGVSAKDIAYIIFTSGSTGDPKGVEVPRSALSNFLLSMAKRPGIGPNDRVLALTTISFDIAALELYLPLIVGASVDIADRDLALDPAALGARLAGGGITVFQATPAYYRMLLESGWTGQANLKVLCGGEAFPPEIVRALLPKVASVWNMYGPTETTVWSSLEQLTSADLPISIGRPIANTELYILNDALEPVPPGVTGMLWIGGDGVALGYHRRPDLTDLAFKPDPFSGRPGARIYRTGDLARRLPDGRLECLGRDDFQVKIRGYRIELGEIEAAMLSHTAVQHAVVHLKPAPNGDKRLVGYVVRKDRASEAPPDLGAHLKAHLPPYMVPAAFMALAALPLTPNGKVDRKALPEPEDSAEARSVETIAPRDDTELKVAEIFARLLGLPSVSVRQSFFDAGGHSLLAVRVTREVNAAFGTTLSLGVMFEHPTVEGLAQAIRDGGGSLGSAVLPLHAGSDAQPIYFICGIQLYQQLARSIGPRHASYGLYVAAEEAFMQEGADLRTLSIAGLAEAYTGAIVAHRPEGPLALAGVSFGGLLAFEVARQLRAQGREVVSLTLLDTVLPFALRRNWPAWLAYRMRLARREGPAKAVQRLMGKLRPAQAKPSPVRRDDHLWRLLNSEVVTRYFAESPTYDGPTLIIRAALQDEVDACFEVDDTLGFGGVLRGDVQTTSAAGDHLGILKRDETADAMRGHVERHAPTAGRRASILPPPALGEGAARRSSLLPVTGFAQSGPSRVSRLPPVVGSPAQPRSSVTESAVVPRRPSSVPELAERVAQ